MNKTVIAFIAFGLIAVGIGGTMLIYQKPQASNLHTQLVETETHPGGDVAENTLPFSKQTVKYSK